MSSRSKVVTELGGPGRTCDYGSISSFEFDEGKSEVHLKEALDNPLLNVTGDIIQPKRRPYCLPEAKRVAYNKWSNGHVSAIYRCEKKWRR